MAHEVRSMVSGIWLHENVEREIGKISLIAFARAAVEAATVADAPFALTGPRRAELMGQANIALDAVWHSIKHLDEKLKEAEDGS